jgi:hypothetical protein
MEQAENARLKAEVEELKSQPDPLTAYLYAAELGMDNIKRLKAEVERLEHQVNYWRIEAEVDNARWLRCLQDLEELRASSFVTAVPSHQYERIVKAGDAMAERLMYQGYPATVPAWNAAKNGWDDDKEGKPGA